MLQYHLGQVFKAISNVNNDATLVPFIYSVLGYGASDRPLHIVLGYFLAISGVLIKKNIFLCEQLQF